MLATTPKLATACGATAQIERYREAEALTIRDPSGRLVLAVDAETGRVTLESAGDLELRASGGTVRIRAERLDVDAGTIELRARRLRQRVGVLETSARRILERATDIYREAEGLAQVRARDIRHVALETLRALGRTVRVKAEEDVKLKGEQVHLG